MSFKLMSGIWNYRVILRFESAVLLDWCCIENLDKTYCMVKEILLTIYYSAILNST